MRGALYESARTPTPRTVSGEAYDIAALVSEREVPQHVQMVWHGVNDEWNLRQFLASRVTWGECDLRVDPLGQLVLRHDSFEDTPWRAEERLLRLPELVDAFGEHDRGLDFGNEVMAKVGCSHPWPCTCRRPGV